MRKRLLIFCLFSLAFSCKGFAQNNSYDSLKTVPVYQQSVYLELLGNAGIASINYERLVSLPGKAPTFAFRVGAIGAPYRENSNTTSLTIVMPLEITILTSKKNFTPEFGPGITVMNDYTRNKLNSDEFRMDFMPVFRAGMRYSSNESRFFGRFAVVLLNVGSLEDFGDGFVFPWLSFCYGYRFGQVKVKT